MTMTNSERVCKSQKVTREAIKILKKDHAKIYLRVRKKAKKVVEGDKK